MKTVIVYSSKYGATEKCVNVLKDKIGQTCEKVNLSVDRVPDLSNYETVLLGTSIYAGKMRPDIIKFVETHEVALKDKNVGVLICCKEESSEALHYIETNLPDWVSHDAFIKIAVGHEINLEKMNFIEKTLLKRVFKVKESYSKLDDNALDKIVEELTALG